VARVGDELLRAAQRILQAADHVVERHREPLELVAALHHGQALAQVVLGDLLGLDGHALDRLERPPHQDEPARHRHRHRERQTHGQHDDHLRQRVLDGRARGADLHPIARAIGTGRGNGGDQLIARGAGSIDHLAVGARDADEAVVDLGRIEFLDLAAHCVLAVAACLGHERAGDLPCPPRLDVEQVRFERMPQEE
jgi:hypothetical protein